MVLNWTKQCPVICQPAGVGAKSPRIDHHTCPGKKISQLGKIKQPTPHQYNQSKLHIKKSQIPMF